MVVFVGLLFSLWFFGVPEPVQQRILRNLETHGMAITARTIRLSPTGALLLDEVTLWDSPHHRIALLSVDHLRLGWVWETVRSGKWALRTITVRNGSIRWPLASGKSLELSHVFAKAHLLPDRLELWEAQGLILGKCQLMARGTLRLAGWPVFRKNQSGMPQARGWEPVAEWLTSFLGAWISRSPLTLQVEFEGQSDDLLGSKARFVLSGQDARWHGITLRAISLEGNWDKGVMEIPTLRVDFAPGYLELHARVTLKEQVGTLAFSAQTDPENWAVLLPGHLARWVRHFRSTQLAQIEGKAQFQWKPVWSVRYEMGVSWERFWFGETFWNRWELSLGSDGERVIIPEARLAGKLGELNVSLLRPALHSPWEGRVTSTLHPSAFRGLSAAWDQTLARLQFPGEGPRIEADIRFDPANWDKLDLRGQFQTSSFSFKGVRVLSAQGRFAWQGGRLALWELKVVRPEGIVEGAMEEDFRARLLLLHKLHSTVHVQEVAPAVGEKFPRYVEPYRFTSPPNLWVDGTVDLDEKRIKPATQLSIDLRSEGPMEYDFLGKTLYPSGIAAKITILGRKLTVVVQKARLFDGELQGTIGVDLLAEPPFQAVFELSQADFQKVLLTYFRYGKSTGRMLLKGEVRGVIGKLNTLQGKGTCEIHGGYLLDIPFLGGLFTLIGQAFPFLNLTSAGDAQCDFEMANGAISTQRLKITSPMLTMIGEGKYDYLRDALDMDMRVNVRGPASILFFPVSKLFEFHGSGPLTNPKWESKLF